MSGTAWTAEQLNILQMFYPSHNTENVAFMAGHSVRSTYQKARALGVKKSQEFMATESARRMNQIDHPARAHQYQKGQSAWNRGTKGVVGVHEACRATQFKPGSKPQMTRPIGSTKVDKDGVLLRKVSDAPGRRAGRWRGVHELVWTAANGPLPPKHIVVFKPGMRTSVLEEITVDRVECISLAENMKRNTRHNLPPELREIVQLRAVLTRQINKRGKRDGA
jgi:hypothetical protein